MKTNAAYTNEILAGYLMNNNRVNVESLADNIWITMYHDRRTNEEAIHNTRRKPRSVAIEGLMNWINLNLPYYGYEGFYATNKQVMKFDREHGGSLEEVLDELENWIIAERNEK